MTAFAQHAPNTEDLTEVQRLYALEHHIPEPYLTELLRGGPLYQAAHVLMLVCFVAVLVLLFRRASIRVALLWSLVPSILGATAMWISILALTSALGSYHFEGDVLSILRGIPRPFYFGLALSFVGVALTWISHSVRRPPHTAP